MAGTSAYIYQTDGGSIYQVLLPSDFANALGQQPATGSEPYLPQIIAPRYATWQSLNPASFRSAVITTPQAFQTLPTQIVVASVPYFFKSAIGESVPANPFGSLILASGPQGAPGAPGPGLPLATYDTALGADMPVTGGTGFNVLTMTGMPAGTYLVLAAALISATSGDVNFSALLANDGYPTGVIAPTTELHAVNGTVQEIYAFALITLTGPTDHLYLTGTCDVNATVLKNDTLQGLSATQMIALKITP